MSVAKILEEQRAWLEQATKSLALDRPSEAEAKFPEEVRKRRMAQIETRIAALGTQRDEAVKRYEAAIAEAKLELDRLAAENQPPTGTPRGSDKGSGSTRTRRRDAEPGANAGKRSR
ncbi:MAG: hypothetical protein AB7H71_12065 [Alphaproteobacteria bacterium]